MGRNFVQGSSRPKTTAMKAKIEKIIAKQAAPLALITLGWLFAPSGAYAQSHTKGRAVAPLTPTLRPGDYVWHPEVSPAGPLVILVSLPDQILYVYRNGVRIGRSSVSSGKPGKQ